MDENENTSLPKSQATSPISRFAAIDRFNCDIRRFIVIRCGFTDTLIMWKRRNEPRLSLSLSLNLTALGQRAWIPISEAIFRVLRVCANDAVITSNQNINQRQQQITNHRIHVYTVYSALPWRVAIVHRKSARCKQTTIETSTVNVYTFQAQTLQTHEWNEMILQEMGSACTMHHRLRQPEYLFDFDCTVW